MTMRNDLIASKFAAITPSDSAQVDFVKVYVGGTGNVAVAGEDGTAVTFTACPVGFVIDGHVILVKATGTTATNLIGYKA